MGRGMAITRPVNMGGESTGRNSRTTSGRMAAVTGAMHRTEETPTARRDWHARTARRTPDHFRQPRRERELTRQDARLSTACPFIITRWRAKGLGFRGHHMQGLPGTPG
jgi:hypothetical protein